MNRKSQVLEQFPNLKSLPAWDPRNPSETDVARILTIFLGQCNGASPSDIMRAQLIMEEQFARGRSRGLEEGQRVAYEAGRRDGYNEGWSKGYKTGLGVPLEARKETARVIAKAQAHARKNCGHR